MKKVTIIICIGLLMASCGKYINFPAGIKYGLYRTNGPYFNYYNTCISNGKICAVLGHPCEDSAIYINEGDTQYSFRIRLTKDFVLDRVIGPFNQFTNIPFDEYCREYSKPDPKISVKDFVFSRIIDRDPFLEYYEVDERITEKYYLEYIKVYSSERAEYFALKKVSEEINEMIEAGTLSEHFKKIK